MATNNGGLFAHLTPILKRHSRYIWLGAVLTVISNGLVLINPYLIKLAFDGIESGKPASYILQLCLYMLILTIVGGIARFGMRRTVIWASRKAEYDLRNTLFAKWLDLDATYFDRTRTGDLMAHATNDIEAVRMLTGPAIMHVMNTIASTVVSIAFMSSLSIKLTLATVLPLLLLGLSYNFLGQLVHKRFMAIQQHFSYLTSQVQENLAGVRVIRAYNREASEIDRFAESSQTYARMNLDMMKINGLFQPLVYAIAGGVTLLVLWVGGHQVMDKSITLGTLVAFYGYLGWLVWPMMALGWVISLYQRGTASLKRINKILDTETRVRHPVRAGVDPMEVSGKIEFKNLTFSYATAEGDDDNPVLKNINLTIDPGSRLGITGPTGSGKTSLVALIPRMYPVKPGMLSIDGIDSTEWSLSKLRDAIGFVPQETFLFSDTLEANINFAKDDVALGRIADISKLAALHDDVEGFPAKYDTILGERGITLSGGQKQRTALARAILKSPSIIILDDATSSVDTETEQEIFTNLERVLPGRTSIIISHRVASLKDCDKIVYLENGEIIEEGSHDELVAKNGAYAALYHRQMMEDKLESM
ncbi:MAG: ABC transporter ATP-binding protein [Candidatus Zixiibacteriota bacterium]